MDIDKEDLNTITCEDDIGFILARRPEAETVAQYADSMEKRVCMVWDAYGLGVALRELNQRYCQLGVKFGLSPSMMAQQLVREHRLMMRRHRGSTILFSPEYIKAINPETAVASIKALCRETLGQD